MTAGGDGLAALIVLLLGATTASAAPPPRDPDWPCQQIRMAELSIGAVWSGPDLTAELATWSQDAAVAGVARQVAERRMPLEQARQAIRDFADAAGTRRGEKLRALAAGVFATLDAERAQVVTGLDRFGLRQKQLATDIRADMEKVRAEQPAAAQQPGPLEEQLGWETRLFEQRRQSVAYACDVPNVIEQRLFALTRTIQDLLR